jgi:hypothetical protein
MSTPATTILAATFVAASLGFAALPTAGDRDLAAVAFDKDQTRLSERLDDAFALAAAVTVDEATVQRIASAARKADKRAAAKPCKAQAWPYIAADCLSAAGAGTPASPVRTVTVEYRVGDSTSVLVRLPATQIAGR